MLGLLTLITQLCTYPNGLDFGFQTLPMVQKQRDSCQKYYVVCLNLKGAWTADRLAKCIGEKP